MVGDINKGRSWGSLFERHSSKRVMFANVSNFTNSSLLPAQAPPLALPTSCFIYSFSFSVFMSFSVTNVSLMFPFCFVVLFLALRRRCWRTSTTHSDAFTYHMVTMEMVGVSACIVYIYGFLTNKVPLLFSALQAISFTSYGELYFHILTCFDRFLAVVYPITYLRLKERSGARLRNVIICCVWLLFVVHFLNNYDNDMTVRFIFLVLSTVVILFFNFAVLYVLIRPPPGERVQVSQSKRRAFHTILAIMSAFLTRATAHLLVVGVYESDLMSEKERCGFLTSGVFFSLPSSLVLPLLFLHRAKLTCCKKKTESTVTAVTS